MATSPTWSTMPWGAPGTALPAGATTNQKILVAAMRKGGLLLRPNVVPAQRWLDEAIDEENRMIGSWNCSPLSIFHTSIDVYTTIPNQQIYTIGIDPTGQMTADWNGPRPQLIIGANMLLPTDADPIKRVRRHLKIWDRDQWRSIRFQGVYTYPEGLYCDYNSPLAQIYFRPIPDAAYDMELYNLLPIPAFASVDDVVVLPQGWDDALVNNLAVRLSTFPWTPKVPMDPQVAVEARRSLEMVQQMNALSPRLVGDAQLTEGRGWWNWLSGEQDEP